MKLSISFAALSVLLVGATAHAQSAPPPPAPAADPVFHVEGTGLALEEQTASGWSEVCSAPCDRPLPLARTYRVVGAGMRASRPIAPVVSADGRVIVRVESSTSKATLPVGIALSSVGVAALSVATVLWAVPSCHTTAPNTSSGWGIPSTTCERDTDAPIALAAVGVPLLVAGIVTTVVGAQPSRVGMEQGASPPAAVRRPEWQRAYAPAPVAGQGVMVPLLSGKF